MELRSPEEKVEETLQYGRTGEWETSQTRLWSLGEKVEEHTCILLGSYLKCVRP